VTPIAKSNWNKAILDAQARGVWEGTLLVGTVGSVVHGLNLRGAEDHDLMGVCIEPIERVVGLTQFEQFVHRTAVQRALLANAYGFTPKIDANNARSQTDDIDLTIYSLRKYVRLALAGNPTILTLLFVPHDYLLVTDGYGYNLQLRADQIVSKRAGKAYLGYMQAQKQRLLGERGGRHGVREDRINQFGYDSKYAMHILRLATQGIELMQTGKLTLPMSNTAMLIAVREGKIPLDDVLQEAGDLERALKDAIDTSPLPEKPNTEAVEKWMIKTYRGEWKL
jgi:predicted nucleotidyltransferase